MGDDDVDSDYFSSEENYYAENRETTDLLGEEDDAWREDKKERRYSNSFDHGITGGKKNNELPFLKPGELTIRNFSNEFYRSHSQNSSSDSLEGFYEATGD